MAFGSILGSAFELKTGVRQYYEIFENGELVPPESSVTISKNGGQRTLQLAFKIEGIDIVFVTAARGSIGLRFEATTVVLRTSVDGELHKLKLEPASNGSVVAEVLD